MSKNVTLGILAGVAAVVVVGFIAKKTGILDTILSKISDMADEIEDQTTEFKKVGMGVIPKGEEKNVPKSSFGSHN